MSSTPAIWSTLRHRQFRALWRSGGVYFIGNAMQVMAARVDDDRADRLGLPRRRGADGGVPADVPAARCRPACSPTPPTGAA
jgi:hypothetical protein